MTFAILYFLNTVPSVDSSISITIQPVITRDMLNITVLVNVRKYSYIHIIYSPNDVLFCCVDKIMLNRNVSVGI